ncbi:YceI family protein [Pontivivens insulae]|uniref:Protein YceI n=1 Tax=Pontivivens insulae TaxID=1639689 RepID=A0A2R8ABV1_9RHOB|nr:YceI family protein [Pontivivens insulae]RED11139.1 polyisoprenoid-binding protein YceI [Pontivivens insulae]SPF29687.1 Protein YceI [Pontivivens insulae]
MLTRTLALTTALIAAPLAAQADWEVDPTHAHIEFEVSHLGFSKTQGQFDQFDISVSGFDPENIEAVSVTATINAASVNTGHEPRDAHLNRADFLGTDDYPEITFASTSVSQTGDNTATITGDLTLLGETREVTFDAVMNAIGPNPFNPGQQIAGFTVSGEVNRADFGMGFGVPAIPAEIPVEINIELVNNG